MCMWGEVAKKRWFFIKTKVKDVISKGVELEDYIAIAQEKRKADKINAQSKTDVKEKNTPKKK